MNPDLSQLTRRTFLSNAARESLLNPASLFPGQGKWRGILPAQTLRFAATSDRLPEFQALVF